MYVIKVSTGESAFSRYRREGGWSLDDWYNEFGEKPNLDAYFPVGEPFEAKCQGNRWINFGGKCCWRKSVLRNCS